MSPLPFNEPLEGGTAEIGERVIIRGPEGHAVSAIEFTFYGNGDLALDVDGEDMALEDLDFNRRRLEILIGRES